MLAKANWYDTADQVHNIGKEKTVTYSNTKYVIVIQSMLLCIRQHFCGYWPGSLKAKYKVWVATSQANLLCPPKGTFQRKTYYQS